MRGTHPCLYSSLTVWSGPQKKSIFDLQHEELVGGLVDSRKALLHPRRRLDTERVVHVRQDVVMRVKQVPRRVHLADT